MDRMKQLSGLDALFLQLETPAMPMHVGALNIYELPKAQRGRFVTRLRRHMAERLPLTPALRRRLWWMPLNLANPAWVDAEPDLDWHIVEHRLPKGSDEAALEALVAELHPQLLDRRRPLWRFHVIEGLAPGANGLRRIGLYTQLHHAAVDGQAAVALANAILDASPTPAPREIRASQRPRHYRLTMVESLRGALVREAQQLAGIVRELPSTLGTLGGAAKAALATGKPRGKAAVKNLGLAPRTPLNTTVGEGRAFAAVSLPLPEMKALATAWGGTLNDAVLMVCAGALRRWLVHHLALPRQPLIAAVPISLRAAGDTNADNQASMGFVSLGTHLADPKKRLAHILAASAAMKNTMGPLKGILPTDVPSIGVPWLVEAATALYGRAHLADAVPQVANVVISNVPGPAVPLFLAGARMLCNHPTSIIVHGIALNITVQSYDRQMDFGLMADAQAMPDVAWLAQALRDSWAEWQALPPPAALARAATPSKRARAR